MKYFENNRLWSVVDLFSGAGGMSYGFAAHQRFDVVAAFDAENGKPSSGPGKLECNKSYFANIGLNPDSCDLGSISSTELADIVYERVDAVDVLISCAPCTGFSRTLRKNYLVDDPRNLLVSRSAEFVAALRPKVFIMENVGELISGKFKHHFEALKERLDTLGYSVSAEVHKLEKYGLPQRRRRALIIASKKPLKIHSLSELWAGWSVDSCACTVRNAIGGLNELAAGQVDPQDAVHASPKMKEHSISRLERIPKDGGSWFDLLKVRNGLDYLIPSMEKYAEAGRAGPHPDVYGRLAWDAPAVTIKRECSHAGNGRYSHPEQDRLCTVRELALLQGFPRDYRFVASSLSNKYRHVGDSVPPLISFQIASLVDWILTDRKPRLEEAILPNCTLRIENVVRSSVKTRQSLF